MQRDRLGLKATRVQASWCGLVGAEAAAACLNGSDSDIELLSQFCVAIFMRPD